MQIDTQRFTPRFGASAPPADYFGEFLRVRAICADQASSEDVALSDIWRELRSGRAQIEDTFFTNERCYMLISPSPSTRRPPCPRRVDALERSLLCAGQKGVAIDLGLAPSTVAMLIKQGLQSLGLVCTPSRMPVQLVQAFQAAVGDAGKVRARMSELSEPNHRCRVISCVRPDLKLSELLPHAECVVARLLVEGNSHAEIALRRTTRRRTVANQLAATFRRLGVSGRLELLLKLTSGEQLEASA